MIVIDSHYIISRAFFAAEILLFFWVYMFGTQGFYQLVQLRQECCAVQEKVIEKKSEIGTINMQIVHWNSYNFYKEKMAREELSMARKNELIYYIT